MADQTSEDEVFDFANIEFTREDLIDELNDMVKEYEKLSHSFEEIKAANKSLKNSSIESSIDTLDDIDSLKTELTSVTYDSYESITYNDQTSQKLNHKGKAGIGYQRPENSNPNWLKNKLDKDKVKSGSKLFVPNQPRRNSTKVKSGWRKVQPRRDLNGQNMKSTLNRSHHGFAQTLTDSSTGKTIKREICSDVSSEGERSVQMSLEGEICFKCGSYATSF
ncbi:hypothetical protein F511_20521 [Dorcoceras hygrometricum]|uniref:Uncharacterized protein n=1 Tax=Dorcoceras hygrometricum TaxID=472368 RepID=A0A2Z7B2Y6_9LAMI|nr:hypothetical protein F511_20521 [Dorcoceras hygrometricum]